MLASKMWQIRIYPIKFSQQASTTKVFYFYSKPKHNKTKNILNHKFLEILHD